MIDDFWGHVQVPSKSSGSMKPLTNVGGFSMQLPVSQENLRQGERDSPWWQ